MIITTRCERIGAGDLLDRGVDRLRTIHLALSPDNKAWLDEKALETIWAMLDSTIRDLEPLREALQHPNAQRRSEEILQTADGEEIVHVRMVGGDRNG